jgi:hypothetical protein
MRFFKILVIAFIVALTGCASGVKYNEMQSSIPAMKADGGRIFFYRSGSMLGAGIQPGIMLNGVRVGESQPGGFFYVDAPEGNHEVMCTTEVEKKLTFTLAKGEVKYVKSSVGLGVLVYRVYPELASATEALRELPDLSYIGTPIKK